MISADQPNQAQPRRTIVSDVNSVALYANDPAYQRIIAQWDKNKHKTTESIEFAQKFGGQNFDYMLRKSHEDRVKGNNENQRTYIASKWAVPFHLDSTSSVKALKAGVGTGKTSAICIELQRLACLQPPDANGVRWTKALAIRSTHNELKTTTLQTWQHWAPPSICKVTMSPYINAVMKFPLPDGTTVHFEMEFMAIPDLSTALQVLKGKEVTFIWFNEWPELRQPVQILQEAETRLYRFPAVETAPIRWSGVLIDFNPSAIAGDVYKYFNSDNPDMQEEVSLYEYPPALIRIPSKSEPDNFSRSTWIPNPDADYHRFNNIGYDYWLKMAKKYGHDEDYIRRNVLGEWTLGAGSKSCFPNFSRREQVGDVFFDPTAPVLIGADGGLYPAIIFAQMINGQLYVQRELVVDDMTTENLLDAYVLPMLAQYYPGQRAIVYHDPGNDNRSSNSEDVRLKPLMMWRQRGIEVAPIPSSSNRTAVRHRAVDWFISRRGGMVIHTRCEMLIQAMSGRYQWNLPKSGEYSTQNMQPLKDRFADIADSLQYLCLGLRLRSGGGEGSGTNAVREILDQWGTPLSPDIHRQQEYQDNPFQQQGSNGFLYA